MAHDAPDALRRAAEFDPPAPQWSVLWFSGLVNGQNANFDDAIAQLRARSSRAASCRLQGRGFDFSRDYRLVEPFWGRALYERAKQERGERRARADRVALLVAGGRSTQFRARAGAGPRERHRALQSQAAVRRAWTKRAAVRAARRAARALQGRTTTRATAPFAAARRRYPAANRAAESVVIYDMQRDGWTLSG